MSEKLEAKCPQCKTPVSVTEEESVMPVTCSSCQTPFVPAEIIAESNKKFEIGLYVGMLVVGVGLIVYMAMTGNLKPNGGAPVNEPAAEEAVPE